MFKNEFLLQEIQNHRLYNTKKDYVLDYLDRHNNNNINSNNTNNINTNNGSSSSTTTSSSTTSSVSCLNERGSVLYTTSGKYAAAVDLTQVENNSQSVEVAAIIKEEATNCEIVDKQPSGSRYERFPYLKNSRDKLVTDVSKKFVPPAPSTNSSSNFKRTQSNSCIQARQNQNLVNLPVTTTPRSMFSASVDRLNAVREID